MKISKMFFKTYRENPADAEINIHKLLVRAGYIKEQAAGIYVFLPLGIRALHKLTDVIREEMDKAGACEVFRFWRENEKQKKQEQFHQG